MQGYFKKYERVALWLVVAALATFSLSLSGSIGRLEKEQVAQATRLDRTVVQAEVVPGMPADLKSAWREARASNSEAAADDYLWLTAWVKNNGFDSAKETSVELTLIPAIGQVYAYSAGGKGLTASWGGPQVEKGGAGERSVTVIFPELPPGERHLLFVGVRRDDPAVAAITDSATWADQHRHFWERLLVSTRPGSWADFALTDTAYGFASARTSAEEPGPGAADPTSSTAPAKNVPG